MNSKIKNLLSQLATTRHKFWNISPETGAFLNLLVRIKSFKTVLEIGSSNGYSGIWLAEALSHNKGRLHTMESNKKIRHPLAVQNFEKSGLKNITSILGHAPEAIPKTPHKFDMIFLDATKYEHLSYFEVLKSRINKGGVIITDNAISHQKELKPYAEALKKSKNWESFLLNIGTGLLVSVRIQ